LLLLLLACAACAARDIVTVFVEEAEFALACKNLNEFQMNFNEEQVHSAPEASETRLVEGARLGGVLSFSTTDMKHPVDVKFVKEVEHSDFLFRQVDSSDGSTHAALQPDPASPTFAVHFSSAVHAISVEYSLVFAVGVRLEGNGHTKTKSLSVYTQAVRKLLPLLSDHLRALF